jgi:hypothetical protein
MQEMNGNALTLTNYGLKKFHKKYAGCWFIYILLLHIGR